MVEVIYAPLTAGLLNPIPADATLPGAAIYLADHLRDHAGETFAVADIMPTVVGDRSLNSVEYRRVEVVTYEALRRLAKRGPVQQTGRGAKEARWRLADG